MSSSILMSSDVSFNDKDCTKTAEDKSLDLEDISIEMPKELKREPTKEELEENKRKRLEIEYYIVKMIVRPLVKNVFKTIDDNRRLEHRKRIYKLRKEEQQLQEAQNRKQTAIFSSNIANRLS